MNRPFRVIGIDIGWSNLAMVSADVDRGTFKVTVVDSCMTDLRCISCKDDDCIFMPNNRKAAHLVHHFVNQYEDMFEKADYVVIEAQPILSTHKDVEQLLFLYILQRFGKGKRGFVRLLHPCTMHAHFNMTRGDKAQRRIEIVEITRVYLTGQPVFDKALVKDHLGDSCGYILLFAETTIPDIVFALKPNPFSSFAFNFK
jgi:hypothetical protein